jgi:hypothetical protein
MERYFPYESGGVGETSSIRYIMSSEHKSL